MTLIALDWNATRLHALIGPAGDYPLPVPLESAALDLPAAASLETNPPQLGQAGLRRTRLSPHLVCERFLHSLGLTGSQAPRWQVGRQTYDAAGITTLFWQRLQPLCKATEGVFLALPGYLTSPQADLLRSLGTKQRIKVLGSIAPPLAAALAAHAEHFWARNVLVVDADDHALTLALVKATDEQAHRVEQHVLPQLGVKRWKDRLINGLADRCVQSARRDPRDSASAEQNLFEQLDALIEACAEQRTLHVGIQAQSWYHHLQVEPDQTRTFCAPLVHQAAAAIAPLAASLVGADMVDGIVLTQAAGRLPGLLDAARQLVQNGPHLSDANHAGGLRTAAEDFGEDLIADMAGELGGVLVLPADAPVRAAHQLSVLALQGKLPRGHLEHLAPLPPPAPVEAGPARLHFQGHDYFLRESTYTIGTQPGSQMRFDARRHPAVAARHCEIVTDHRTYILSNRSRDGTLVNDHPIIGSTALRPGDTIRLGLNGPTLRFLGQAYHRPLLPTTA